MPSAVFLKSFQASQCSHLSRWVTKSIFSTCCIKPAHLVQRVLIIVQILCYLYYVQVQFYLFRDFECVLSYPSCFQKGLEGSTHCGVTYVNLHASMHASPKTCPADLFVHWVSWADWIKESTCKTLERILLKIVNLLRDAENNQWQTLRKNLAISSKVKDKENDRCRKMM